MLLLCSNSQAQYFLRSAGSAVIDEGLDICAHSNGNNYTVGYFSGLASFGNFTLSPLGLSDGFISCANSQGDVLWAQKISGTSIDKCLGVCSNGNNIVVVGTFESNLTIGTYTVTSAGLNDVFIAQYDGNGTVLWLKSVGGPGNDFVADVVADTFGNICMAGSFVGTANFGIAIFQSTINASVSTNDMFVSKLDSSGNFLWTKQAFGTGDDKATDIVTDANGNIFVCGQYSDTLTIDVVHPNILSNIACLFKLDANGSEQWFLPCISSSITPVALAVDALNRIAFTGNFSGTLTTLSTPQQNIGGTYNNRIFVMQLDNNGTIQWIKSHSSTGLLRATNVKCTNTNDVIILGEYHCRLNEFADIYGQGIFNSVGYSDIFVCKNKADGTLDWARCMGGPQNDFAAGLALDTNNKIYFTGSFDKKFSAPFQNTTGCFTAGTAAVYCNDLNYSSYCQVTNGAIASGNRDIMYAQCIVTQRQPYDYYIRQSGNCQRDVIPACIIEQISQAACNDTSTICANNSAYLSASARTDGNIGPAYTYQWSNGALSNILVTGGGTYTVTVTTEDGCFSSMADMTVTVVTPPAYPLISDSKGVNNQATATQKVIVCSPDSVIIWASNLAPGSAYFWSVNGIVYYDDTITINQSALCSFTVGTNTQCPATNYIEVQVIQNTNSIHRINVINAVNDTVSNCSNNVHVAFIDSVTSICYKDSVFWSITPMQSYNVGGFPCYSMATMSFIPDTNGWYIISCYGFNAQCGGDTVGPVSVKIYFEKLEVLPAQNIVIAGMRPICPVGDTITLTASGAINYTWAGPNIIGNLSDSSIQITSIGTYTVSSAQLSTDSCVTYSSAGVLITTKTSPQIFTSPNDGIICPNDSVQLGGNIPGTYSWYGPNGLLADTSQITYASLPGTYFFSVVDTDGCQLLSNSADINNYTSPTLIASSNYICDGNTVVVQLITAGGAWSWQPPLSGSDTTVYITAPGTYQCAVLSCGITSILDITITEPTFNTQIQSAATTICIGDSVLLIAPPGYTYLWQHNLSTSDSIYVDSAGAYSVLLTDVNGCTAQSDTITISLTSQPPTPLATVNNAQCTGDTLQLFTPAANGFQYQWTGPNNFSSTLQNPQIIPADTANSGNYYLQLFDGGCGSQSTQVTVLINSNAPIPVISTNAASCVGDTIILTANGNSLQWFGPQNFLSTNSTVSILQASTIHSGWYYCIATGICNSLPDSVLVSINSKPTTPVITGPVIVCTYDTLILNTNSQASVYNWSGPQGVSGNQATFTIYPAINGTYNLQIGNGNCFSDTAYYAIQLTAPPQSPLVSPDIEICQGQAVTMQVINPSTNTYNWTGPNALNHSGYLLQLPAATLNQSGTYIVTANNGCMSNGSNIKLMVDTLPVVSNLSATTLCIGDTLLLDATAQFYQFVNWFHNNQLISQQITVQVDSVTKAMAGYYFVQLTNGVCAITDSVMVKVADCNLLLPNVLTPNNDGYNDTWQLANDAVSFWQLQVFNRWGNTVFNADGKKVIWDGRDNHGQLLSEGTYYYLLHYVFNGYAKTMKGHFSLFR
ncbi:MAG: gliding motility-associated C-terminal domain-containing protein [Bacteroidia bacterium]|nr:gliding motility-associated C-terminal domain-containing protein [Bacteroidia bacterium]